ncbi:ent-kaur-16-ene synthase, chloroplastic-like [Neltuma alba]|uniref:ent-kaur-16-ene synthase, chloroplastic-like n=1 Tax=Neltuma alba TaxID=207710 RepID=UPI0010A4866A|nr:ent-kaur-16-ene synthase, chloroplastic-like [Prosopis alba]
MSLSSPSFQASLTTSATSVGSTNVENKLLSRPNIMFEGNKERIKTILNEVKLSTSSYDTAWVATIASPTSSQAPLFPQTLNWLLQNQQKDGSWSLPDRHELLTKDSLLSTLACVLALKQWGVGERQTNKGLQYIESNIASALDDKQHSPIGFDIIFPHLLEQAQNLDLNLPLGGKRLETFVQKRESELKRGWSGSNLEGWKAYLAYISEGFGKSQDWEMAMKHQRKNGSLFNSPATTASAFTHLNNAQCFDYLSSLLDKFGDAVPTWHPFDVFARIYMVDCLEKLGIDRFFKEEIDTVLNQTYRFWQQEEEDIFLEPTTCAIAFRLLRLHEYDVSSDALSRFSKDKFSNTLQGYLKDVNAVTELHKASQIPLQSNDPVLEELNSWTRDFLKEYLSFSSEQDHKPLHKIDHEVRFALRFPHHTYLDRMFNRKIMENYKADQKRILKTSYSSENLSNGEFIELAVEDFNSCQLVIREEFEQYNRWFMESGMDKLQFPRPKVAYSYLTAAGTHVAPELREARMSWAKNGLLVCVSDDMYDVWGCEEDQIRLVELMEKWDVDIEKENCSEPVKILFLALKGTICEIADQALKIQGRSVKNHLIQLWVDCLKSFLQEAQWRRNNYVPTYEEYLPVALISFALGPILLPGLYLVGPKLSQDSIESDEYNRLFDLVSIYGRLLNDVNGYKREMEQGKLNAIAVRVRHGSGSEEEVVKKVKEEIDESRKELLRMVLQKEGSIIPTEVKDVIWKMARSLYVIYKKEDVIHARDLSDEVISIKDAVVSDPMVLKK